MRFPIILQHDASDCGPAVLAMMAAWHGKRISIARFRELAGTDRHGTTLAGLIRAAQSVGFEARAVRATRQAFPDMTLPVIAHWQENNRNHFVIVRAATRKSIVLADPSAGRRRVTNEAFHKHWSGVLLILKETPNLRVAVTTPASLTRLCSLVLPHRRLFLDALLAAVLMTILGLASSFFIQALVDFVFVLGRKPALNWLGLGMLIVVLARSAFLVLRSILLTHLSQRIDADTVLGYHRHLLGLPLFFFSTRRTGEILSRINDAVKIRVAVSTTTLSVIVDAVLLTATAAIMLAMNWRVTFGPIALALAVAGASWLFSKTLRRHQRAVMEKSAELEALLVEVIGGIQSLKAARAETSARVRIESRFAEMLDSSFHAQMLTALNTTFTASACGLASLGLLWLGAQTVLSGAMTVGALMALNTMLGVLLGPIERLSNAQHTIQDGLVAAERLGEVWDLHPELDFERASAVDQKIGGTIEFDNITFQYGSRAPVLRNFSLRIEEGECVAIMGESGSGKTTLTNLLGRFHEPISGRIEIDGTDIRTYTFECLRREIAFMPQDIVLFTGSIADNIRLGRPNATPAEIQAVARQARVDAIVSRLPLGLDSPVGERGLSLSGGERQRIALARAILQDPAILVLDEPASHLDAESEAAVQSLLDRRRGKRTTIVISHRPLQCDRIVRIGPESEWRTQNPHARSHESHSLFSGPSPDDSRRVGLPHHS
jgi:ATP-binding cassette, subfamily C, bacteriocin exporter